MFKLNRIICTAVGLLLASAACKAGPVTFTLVQANLTGTSGSNLTWQYDVTNNSGGTIYALSVNSDVWQYGTPDPTAFDFFGGGTGIPDGTSLTGPLFAFDSNPSVANSYNSGTFDLQILLPDGSTSDLLTSYSATIGSAVPEPSSASLLLTAGMAALVFRRRRPASSLMSQSISCSPPR